jgi:hypothetical protein
LMQGSQSSFWQESQQNRLAREVDLRLLSAVTMERF